MLHLFAIPAWLNASVVVAVAIAAFWKGGWREQLVAGMQLADYLFISFVCNLFACPVWADRILWPGLARWHVIVGDGIWLVAALICVWRAERYWTLWAAAFALLSVACDLLALLPRVSLWAFASADLVWGYGMSAAVLAGVWATARESTVRARPSP